MQASLTGVLCGCSPAGPDINAALVLDQKKTEEAVGAPAHLVPTSMASSTYVNYGFQHSANGVVGDSSLPRSGPDF